MKTFLLTFIFLTGCTTLQNIVPFFHNPNEINETNYMETPCILDGTIVKKKPKNEIQIY